MEEENNNQTQIAKKNNGLALASFILSLVGLIVAGIPCGIAAVVTGILGITKFDSNTQKNKWMAIVGLVLGAIDVIATILILPTIYKSLGIM